MDLSAIQALKCEKQSESRWIMMNLTLVLDWFWYNMDDSGNDNEWSKSRPILAKIARYNDNNAYSDIRVNSDSKAVSSNYSGVFYHECKDLSKPFNLICVLWVKIMDKMYYLWRPSFRPPSKKKCSVKWSILLLSTKS